MATEHPARQAFFDALEAKYDRMVRREVERGTHKWVAESMAGNEIFSIVIKMLNEESEHG
jgi:hypothetical protein